MNASSEPLAHKLNASLLAESFLVNALERQEKFGILIIDELGFVSRISNSMKEVLANLFSVTLKQSVDILKQTGNDEWDHFVVEYKNALQQGKLAQFDTLTDTTESRFTWTINPLIQELQSVGVLITVKEKESPAIEHEALANQRQFFESILNNVPADIAVFSPSHKYIYLNQSAVKDPEMREWLIGKDDFDYCRRKNIGPELAVKRHEVFTNSLELGNSHLEEIQSKDELGNITWSYRKFFPYYEGKALKYVIGYGVDVTEVKRQRARFLEIVNNLDQVVFQLDEVGCFTFLSKSWEKLTRLGRFKCIGSSLIDYVAEEDIARVKQAIDKVLARTNLDDNIEFRLKLKDGDLIWARLNMFFNHDVSEEPLFAGTITDIHNEKLSLDIIQKQRLAIENSIEGVAVMNNNDQYTYLNKAHLSLFGYEDESEILGKSWTVFYPENEIERIAKEVFPEFLEKGSFRGPTLGLKKDGSLIHQEISLTALPDGGLICITHDVTDQIARQEELKRLAIVAEKTNSIVIIGDKKGCIQWVNESFELLTGYSAKEVHGKCPWDFLAGSETDPKTIDEIKRNLKNGEPFRGEIMNYDKAGKGFWLYLDITPVKNEKGEIQSFIAVENNITALKRAEENTLKALSKERQLNQFKSHFVNLVSHEFRTPLATIQSSMDVIGLQIKKNLNGLPEAMRDSFNRHHFRIENEISRMTEIMNNILLMGRLDAGRMVFNPEQVCVTDIMTNMVQEFNENNQEKRKISIEIIGEGKFLTLDTTQMRYVFSNLISNALKYSEGAEDPQITVNYASNGVYINVRDFGIGIPEAEVAHMFTSFYRASNTTNIQGTGLGLVIVKQLVEMHGGKILINHHTKPGTEFSILMPYQA